MTGFVKVTVKAGCVPQRLEPHKCLGTPARTGAVPVAHHLASSALHVCTYTRVMVGCTGWDWVKIDGIGRGEQAGRVFKPLQSLVEGGPGSGRRSDQSMADLVTGAEVHPVVSA